MVGCRGGIFLNQQTQVNSVKVKSRAARLVKETVQTMEIPEKKNTFGTYFLQLDRLVRNFAVVGALVLVLIAVRNSSLPEAQSVFGVIQDSAALKWDESIGKLSFVNGFFPEEIREVWNESTALTVFAPVRGRIIHAWSREEPYLLMESSSENVRAAADGEVMSVAHGVNEERILRLRHVDGSDSIYGNLESCHVETGDFVAAGDVIGTLINGRPLAFEARSDGRSVDVSQRMLAFVE